ncbi:mycofactocin oligosaccharide methyltransferase MftM [Rubrobacter marinus]|uniref:mycofactocin oligosaccharide methyltransferase MftM n=1 Tax=Rubrobacter marinus TaxID=2653852 RepID=UPI00140B3C70|nr:mycofactocin oligosaccharide methyltransferase MftM [Rubrobacter marinus]
MLSEAANPGARDVLANGADRIRETSHFVVFAFGDATVVLHGLEPPEVDNDLAELVAGELVRPGRVAIPDAFERCFAGVVRSSAPDPREAWRAFYGNTLSRLREVAPGTLPEDYGPIAVFGRIYEHARRLVVGSSLLDVGTCFGFFPLMLQEAKPELEVVALDLSAPILELARDAALSQEHANPARFVQGDACDLPFADGSFDTVAALHVMEHLNPLDASRALRETCRVARRRVIVAVPMEEEADLAYDHAQSFDRERLISFGRETGWRCRFEEYLGGWVILEPS